MLVHDPEAQPSGMADIVEQGLRLPKGAARLAAALAADDDLKRASPRGRGSPSTPPGSHLRTALARTGARTQAELVRMVVRLLRDFALAEPASQTRAG